MQSKASTIPEYIAMLAPKERTVVEALDQLVRAAAPQARGSMRYGMPTYEVMSRIIAFNAQKNYFSFYADPEIVKRHLSGLKGLDVGKSCIRFRKIEDVSLSTLKKIVEAYSK